MMNNINKKSLPYVVYQIKNIINDRIYIGSSVNFKKRKSTHLRELKNNNHENIFLQRDYNKCGKISFVFEILLETDCKELLLDFEQHYIDQYWDNCDKCYNHNQKAYCPPSWKGKKHSIETKQKISNSHKGKKCAPFSEAHKRKLSEACKGDKNPFYDKHLSDETKLKISKAKSGEKHHMYGKHHSISTKEKMSKNSSKYWLGKNRSEETKRKMSNNNPKYWLGKHHSEETKKKISESLKGKYFGKKHPMYGKHLSEEIKLKISKANKGKRIGENNHFFGKKHTEEVKRKMSIVRKDMYVGDKNPRFDSTIYHFYNEKLNIEEICTRYDLIKKYNLHQGAISLVINSKKKSYKGWKIFK